MASEKQHKPKKSRTTVPVASRAADRKATRKTKPAVAGSGRSHNRLDLVGFGVLVLVALLILAVIAVPLRNYYQGRTEIVRLNESIIAKQDEKEHLLSEIEKYESDAYIEQEARRRLGVVGEGEVAFRILDPEITSNDSVTTDEHAEAESRDWYEVLWDSIATKPDPESPILGVDDPANTKDAPAGETPEGANPADGNPAGEGSPQGDEPVGNVVEDNEDTPDPVGEMPPGEVPSGQ